MKCPSCQTEMSFGTHPISTQIGVHVVANTSVPHERCPACGYYELDAAVGELIEVQAAVVVMTEATQPDPKAVRFARKAMGHSQAGLAEELGLTQETISRYETGALPIVPEYRFALAGLLGREERKLRGGTNAPIQLAPTGTGG
jgi:DNA-binding XRE family transcriptional regulator